MRLFFVFFAAFLGTILIPSAQAQVTGRLEMNAGALRWYNGSAYVSVGGQAQSACSQAGRVQYNSGANAIEWCNGSNWQRVTGGTTNGSCTGNAGRIRFSSPNVEYCNATNWVRLAYASAACSGCVAGSTVYSTASSGTTFNVPANCDRLRVRAWGGGGGGGSGAHATGQPNPGFGMRGGGGGFATSILTVTPGEALTIRVGGGGAGGADTTSTNDVGAGGGGGGYSGVFRSSTPLVIAGGGGGGGGGDESTGFGAVSYGGYGGGGGGATAFHGSYFTIVGWQIPPLSYPSSGSGGTQSAGGAAGGGDQGGSAPTAGSSLQGGAGGGNLSGLSAGGTNGGGAGAGVHSINAGGGGGGGGYFGGGGGGGGFNSVNCCSGGGAGGGSGYITGNAAAYANSGSYNYVTNQGDTTAWATPAGIGGDERAPSTGTATGYAGNAGRVHLDYWCSNERDYTANAATFTDVTNAIRTYTYVSNSITVAGVDANTPFSVVFSENDIWGGYYSFARKNGTGSMRTGVVSNGDTIDILLNSASTSLTTTSASLYIGETLVDTFSVTTALLQFEDIYENNSWCGCTSCVANGTSSIETMSGIANGTAVSLSGCTPGTNCWYLKNGVYLTAPSTVNNGDTLAVMVNSGTTATLTVGSHSDSFTWYCGNDDSCCF